ncbi:MAG: hypothetical protein WBV27_04390 [Trichococcus sp.]|uniref:hypothetical protein n=1 Tax=Trichococcus sp. TaxID=1985464 RepID=UPI003C677265
MTLVEVLASILLLSLIITTFMSFFIQAAKVNNRTDAVNEATFIAQEQIELLTYYSNTKSAGATLSLIEDESPKTVSGFEVTYGVETSELNDALYKGTVTVSKGGENYAEMETLLSFRTAD